MMRHHLHALLLAAQVSGVLKSEHVCPLGRQNGESSPTRTHCVPPGHVLHWRATQVLLPAHHPHPGLDAQDEQSDSDSATAIPSLHETQGQSSCTMEGSSTVAPKTYHSLAL